MDIEEVARELYGLPPEEFTASRNARAKEAREAGDRDLATAVQALRKPTTGAALLNAFVRRHEDDVSQVLALGAQLREAQGTLGAPELRALDQQRRQLTTAVARQVRALGEDEGRRVTAQVTADVEETLRSAMVDQAAGQALATGLLTDTFSANGIEPVDLDRVVALPGLVDAGPSPLRAAPASHDGAGAAPDTDADADREREVESARSAARETDSALEAAQELARAAARAATEAAGRHDRLTSERDELRARLAELEAAVAAAAEEHDTARGAAEQAAQDEDEARSAAERARQELDDLLG